MTQVLIVALAAYLCLAGASLITWFAGHRDLSDLLELLSLVPFGGMVAIFWLDRDWGHAILYTLVLAFVIWVMHRRRKKRRTLAALGNKAKARIEAMKQAMRERAKPRPVLKPGLQGAR